MIQVLAKRHTGFRSDDVLVQINVPIQGTIKVAIAPARRVGLAPWTALGTLAEHRDGLPVNGLITNRTHH